MKLLLELGAGVNAVDGDGRTALHGAAHKGRNEIVQLLVDRGAKLDARDGGSRDSIAGELIGHTWTPLDYADGLVRVGVQSAIPHPETPPSTHESQDARDAAPPLTLGPTVSACHFLRGRFGTNARNLRGLSTMIRCKTSSLTPAVFSLGTNTVRVLAYPLEASDENMR